MLLPKDIRMANTTKSQKSLPCRKQFPIVSRYATAKQGVFLSKVFCLIVDGIRKYHHTDKPQNSLWPLWIEPSLYVCPESSGN